MEALAETYEKSEVADDSGSGQKFAKWLMAQCTEEELQELSDFAEENDGALTEKQTRAKRLLSLNQSVTNRFRDFFIEVQPIVNAANKTVLGGEVLLRWKQNGQVIAPSEFIPLMEAHHLIHPIGNWVFEQTVALCKKAIRYVPDILISCNISYLQILKSTFFLRPQFGS